MKRCRPTIEHLDFTR